jgi:MATE family multidrug resistance protein
MPGARRAELRDLLVIAGPLVLAQLAQNGMSFVDTIMVGRLGGGPLAGMALGGVVFNMTFLMTMALVMSVSPLAAQAVGGGDPRRAAVVARHGLLLALLLAVPAAAFVYFAGPLLGFFGQDPAVVAGATEYLRAVCFGLVGAIGMVSLRGLLEGFGTTRPIMVIAMLGVLTNIIGNEILIFGRLGAPALGLAGAGYATSITYTLMAVLLVVFVRWKHPSLPVFRRWRDFDPRLVRELLKVGWPIALTLGFEVGLFTAASLVMGYFGDAPLAGHQIAMQTVSMAFMVPLGVGIATGVRVGHAAGRGDPRGVRRAGWTGIAIAGGFMVLTAAVFLAAPRAIVGIYLDLDLAANAPVVGYAVTFLALGGVFQVFDGVQVAAVGALRGLKDTRVPMFMTLVAYWLVGMPVGLLFAFVFDLGPRGMWFGLVISLVVAAVLLTRRFWWQTRRLESARGQPTGLDSRAEA